MIPNRLELTAQAMGALQRLRSNQKLDESAVQSRRKPDYSLLVFEEYDDESFANKCKIDSLLYKSMLRNLNQEHSDSLREILTQLMETTQSIYRHINIKPAVYGFNNISIFNESDEVLEETALRLINEFVDNQYYSLSKEEREKKYMVGVKAIAETYVLEHQVDSDESVRFATKTLVMEEFIKRINFPLNVRNKIYELIEDEEYGRIFNQDVLREHWESFEKQCHNLSKIVAATI